MTMIVIGFISIFVLKKANVSDGVIIADAILAAGFSIMDKLWDIRIRLTEIENAIKRTL